MAKKGTGEEGESFFCLLQYWATSTARCPSWAKHNTEPAAPKEDSRTYAKSASKAENILSFDFRIFNP